MKAFFGLFPFQVIYVLEILAISDFLRYVATVVQLSRPNPQAAIFLISSHLSHQERF
jgi:hypothetical protein